MGGFPAQPEEEAQGLLIEVNLIYLPYLYLQVTFCSATPFIPPYIFYFIGTEFVKQASSLCEEACKLESEVQRLETEGLEKMEVAVTGSEVGGLYGLLRGALAHSSLPTSSPPPKKTCHDPFSFISHLPPQEPKEPEASVSAEQALESTSSTAPSVLEGEIPAEMQPLHIQLGGIKRVYRCQVEGCREGPSTSHATMCAQMCKVHLGVGLVCPLYNKSFFNPDTFRCHKKSHINL